MFESGRNICVTPKQGWRVVEQTVGSIQNARAECSQKETANYRMGLLVAYKRSRNRFLGATVFGHSEAVIFVELFDKSGRNFS